MRTATAALLLFGTVSCSGGPRPASPDPDADRDGFTVGGSPADCDDADPFVHPGATEFCDGRDDDCDGVVDGPDPIDARDWFADRDGDGFGVPDEVQFGCSPGSGWAEVATDCDDTNVEVHPRRDDPCNGRDDDCDEAVDEDPTERWHVDADGDGHGDPDVTRRSCEGTVPLGDDCDDTQPTVYPGAVERCDGFDNDCDLLSDAFEAVVDPPTWYADLDGDGFGLAEVSLVQCVPPSANWALAPGDCDDLDAETHPGAVQRCVPQDTDCDGAPGDDAGWFAPEAPARVWLEVEGTGAAAAQPAIAVVDFAAALAAAGVVEAPDLGRVLVAVQDCDAGGAALPATAVDGLGDPFRGELDALGDGVGALAFALDRPLAAGQRLALAAYLHGDPGPAGTLSASSSSLAGADWSATFDPDRGALLDTLADAAGVRLLSQADAREGNGVRTAGAWTQPTYTPVEVVADGVLSLVVADGLHDADGGVLRSTSWWFGVDGVPAVYLRVVFDAETDLAWDDPVDPRLAVRPFEAVPLDLDAVGADTPQYLVSTDVALAAGVAIGWVDAPPDIALAECDPDGCRIAASDGLGAAGAALAGERIVEGVLAIAPLDAATLAAGPAAVADRMDAVTTPLSVSIGAAEARPAAHPAAAPHLPAP